MSEYISFPWNNIDDKSTCYECVSSSISEVTKDCSIDMEYSHSIDPGFFQDYQAAPITLRVVKNARLISGTLVIDPKNCVVPETVYQAALRSRPDNWPIKEKSSEVEIHKSLLSPTLKLNGVYFLFNTLRENFGHWHTQALINTAFLECLPKEFDGVKPILVNAAGFPACQAFRDESKKVFCLQDFEFINPLELAPQGTISFEYLIIPSTLSIPPNNRFNRFIGKYLRSRLLPFSSNKKPDNKLFISRKDVGGRRGFENEDEVASALEKIGFQTVDVSSLAYIDQIKLFSESSFVVSPHGGALTNTLSCSLSSAIFEFFHSQQINPWYRILCDSIGLGYSAFCVHLDTSNRLTEADIWCKSYKINLDWFMPILERKIAGAAK